jgi:alpha-ketoglutarate-dependent taurine dioxygenase
MMNSYICIRTPPSCQSGPWRLLAREVPPYGGDTLFASQYAAWDALSPTLKRLLDGLQGTSSSAKADVGKMREDCIKEGGTLTSCPHAPRDRKGLYVNAAHTAGIVGIVRMTDKESVPLLQFLFAHQVKPEFTCRFVWEPGSIALWENRCVQHNPVNDYHGFRRVMLRITLRGEMPVLGGPCSTPKHLSGRMQHSSKCHVSEVWWQPTEDRTATCRKYRRRFLVHSRV